MTPLLVLLVACETGKPTFGADARWDRANAEAGWDVVRLDYQVRGRSWSTQPEISLDLLVNGETWAHQRTPTVTLLPDGLEAVWFVPVPAEAQVMRGRVATKPGTGAGTTERTDWALLTVRPTDLVVTVLETPLLGAKTPVEVVAPPYWMADPTLRVQSTLDGDPTPGSAASTLAAAGDAPRVATVEVPTPSRPGMWSIEARAGTLSGRVTTPLAQVPDEVTIVARDAPDDSDVPARERGETLPCRELDVTPWGAEGLVSLSSMGGTFASGAHASAVVGDTLPFVIDEQATAVTITQTRGGTAVATAVVPLREPSAETGVLAGPSRLAVGKSGSAQSTLRAFTYDPTERPVSADAMLVIDAIADPSVTVPCAPLLDASDLRCDPTGWLSGDGGGCLLTTAAPTSSTGELSQALASVCFAGDVTVHLVARGYTDAASEGVCRGERAIGRRELATWSVRLD